MLRSSLTRTVALLLCTWGTGAIANTFDVKGPEITKGEAEVGTNHAFSAGFPVNADGIWHGWELGASYGFTDHFKAGLKASFHGGPSDGERLVTVGVETQVLFGKFGPSIVAWYSGFDLKVRSTEANLLTFGPIVKFGDDKLSLTINTLLAQPFDSPDGEKLGFQYAIGLKKEIADGVSLGIESHGFIPDIGNAPGIDFQEHRIGPVVYLEAPFGKKKLAIEFGGFVGLTEATPDWTGKMKASLTW